MKRKFQIFWIKFKKFIENPFYWNIAAVLLSAILSAYFIWQGEIVLAIAWILCAIINIWFTWIDRDLR